VDLSLFPRTRDKDNVYIGPLSHKEYEMVKEYFSSLGVGYSATYGEKKTILIVTDARQLARGGIVMEFNDAQLSVQKQQ
jgi:predicted RNase H-like nuclease (RuvC/YqgF family)